MSVTTTQNPVVYSISRTLADYDLLHSEQQIDGSQPVADPNPHPAPFTESNPEGWETEYRRVPAYRPINYDLDFTSRNTTTNNIERFFLINMFGGIRLVEVGLFRSAPTQKTKHA